MSYGPHVSIAVASPRLTTSSQYALRKEYNAWCPGYGFLAWFGDVLDGSVDGDEGMEATTLEAPFGEEASTALSHRQDVDRMGLFDFPVRRKISCVPTRCIHK